MFNYLYGKWQRSFILCIHYRPTKSMILHGEWTCFTCIWWLMFENPILYSKKAWNPLRCNMKPFCFLKKSIQHFFLYIEKNHLTTQRIIYAICFSDSELKSDLATILIWEGHRKYDIFPNTFTRFQGVFKSNSDQISVHVSQRGQSERLCGLVYSLILHYILQFLFAALLLQQLNCLVLLFYYN